MKEITNDMLAQFRASYDADRQAQVLHSALAKTDMAELAYVPVAGARLKGAFFGGSEDPGDYGPAEIRPLLALCGPQHFAGKGG